MKKICIIFIVIILLFTNSYISLANLRINELSNNKTKVIEINFETQEKISKEINYEKYLSINETYSCVTEDSIMPNCIIGNDNREIPNSSEWPYGAICYIEGYDSNGNAVGYGTGVLVSPDILVTNAHVILAAKSFWVFPGMENNTMPFGKTSIDKAYIPQEFIPYESSQNNGNCNYDWAVCRLKDKIGNSTGWMNMVRYEEWMALAGEPIWLQGYQRDAKSLEDRKNIKQYKSVGSVIYPYEKSFQHNADCVGGSGSPIARVSDNSIVGLHAIDDEETSRNKAVRVSNDFFYAVVDAINGNSL